MKKKSYLAQMSSPVTEAEKKQAEASLVAFEKCLNLLNISKDHLDIMYTPFKDHPEISPEEITKFRAAIRRFRDKVLDNFGQFKISAVRCITLMTFFSSDTDINNLLNSFINAVGELETDVNEFSSLFNKLEGKDFVPQVLKQIETIQSKCDEIKEIVEERVMEDIKTDILGKTWIDSITEKHQLQIEKKKPLILELSSKEKAEANKPEQK